MIDIGSSGARRWVAAVVYAGLLVMNSAGAHPAAFTIDEVMQAPYPSDLLAAPEGKAVAWVFDTKGVRNIWVADASVAAKARQITAYTQDDGFDIGELAWSPDERSIAFTRAETLEDEAPANVNSAPEGATPREVWLVPIAGGAPRKLGTGHSASFSPDGGQVVFVATKQILAAAVNGTAAAHPLLVDEGAVSSLTWAPDGKRIAFVSNRGSHSLVGVYEVATRSIVWLSPSLDEDFEPTFSPDGSRIAFVRVLAEKTPEFLSRRSGRPWSIWTADVRTGEGRRVWLADVGPGSVFHPTLSPRNLFWTNHDELVFPWEKTG
jgi:Tol biopolymer transport system component